jgi:hypothetical protein
VIQNPDGTTAPGATFTSAAIPMSNIESFAPPQRPIGGVAPMTSSTTQVIDIPEIDGESTDAKHPGAIDIRTFDWSADGAPGEAPRFGELHTPGESARRRRP